MVWKNLLWSITKASVFQCNNYAPWVLYDEICKARQTHLAATISEQSSIIPPSTLQSIKKQTNQKALNDEKITTKIFIIAHLTSTFDYCLTVYFSFQFLRYDGTLGCREKARLNTGCVIFKINPWTHTQTNAAKKYRTYIIVPALNVFVMAWCYMSVIY